jgi:hypothetical protein
MPVVASNLSEATRCAAGQHGYADASVNAQTLRKRRLLEVVGFGMAMWLSY